MPLLRPEEIEAKLRTGEDSVTEFKAVARDGYRIRPEAIARAIVALANTRGGHILIGVEDDGTPSGVGSLAEADQLMRQVVQACNDAVHPPLACAVEKTEVGAVPILVVEVPAFSAGRPFRTGHIHYIREANRSREATREELLRVLQSADVHFDDQPVRGAGIDDLDPLAATETLRHVYGDGFDRDAWQRYLKPLRCLTQEGVPTVAGVLFFGRDPQCWLPEARVSAARLPGVAVSDEFLDHREISGRLPAQLEAAFAFLEEHGSSPERIEGPTRTALGIPSVVLREALVNALTHRDYRAAAQVRLLVYDDRVEVHNPGVLLNQLTIENIREGIGQRRNPAIAALLARLEQRESLGLGIPRMIARMRERGLAEPEFRQAGGHFSVVLRRHSDA